MLRFGPQRNVHNISSGYQVSGSGVGLFHIEVELLVVGGGSNGNGNDVGGSAMALDGRKGAYLCTAASELMSCLDAQLLPAGNVGGLVAMLHGRQEETWSGSWRRPLRLPPTSTDVRATRRGEKAGAVCRRWAGRSSTSCVQVCHHTAGGGVGGAIEQARTCRGIVVVNTTTSGGIANKSILERIDEAELLVRGCTG